MIEYFLAILLAASGAPAADPEAGAKALFYDPALGIYRFSPAVDVARPASVAEDKVGNGSQRESNLEAAPRPLGICSWIQQVDDRGGVRGNVGLGHTFHSGDRIQLVVKSNDEGYLALVQEGADGRIGMLYPTSEQELGKDNIQAHSTVLLPGPRHSFTFDHKPGVIRLLVVVARTREELAALPLRREMGRPELESLRQIAARERGAKNLIIEAFADPQEDPKTYTVNRAGGTIIQEISLVHEP